ncbi:MAG: Crp/Fnr family transcriptional regulator [Alphaproteobacteria bacterium]|nr:Crp/Fnr family transcriptional regulator [Alphaproteobacteria bacterium]
MSEPESPSPLVRKLRISLRLTRSEIRAIERVQGRRRTFAADADLITAGKRSRSVRVIESGWACRHKLFSDGRRQIINFVLPGDIVGLNEYLVGASEYSVTTLTSVRAAMIAPRSLIDVFRAHPRLAMALAWSVARYESLLAEQIVRLGRRNAYEGIAHILLELHKRLQAVGLAGESSYQTPITQEMLADAMGLSIVHVNRTLGRLKRQGLVAISDGRVVLGDAAALAAIADFETDYLLQRQLPPQPRTEILSTP